MSVHGFLCDEAPVTAAVFMHLVSGLLVGCSVLCLNFESRYI